MLKPVGKSILFVFLDDVSGGWFYEKTSGGLIVPKNVDSNITQCRWGKVVAVGADVDELIKPKMNVLIEAMKWTTGVDYDGIKIWRTNYDSIVGIEEESTTA